MTAPNITQKAGKALREVFRLLETHFDADQGCYLNDYSDERIAKETDISKDAVKKYRIEAFGKIKPPNDIYLLRQELRELETFALQTENDMRQRLKDINLRLTAMERKFD